MDSICDQIQRRLMEPRAAQLNSQERLHLQACGGCREFRDEVAWAEPAFETAKRATDRKLGIALSAALRGRVHAEAKQRIAAIREAERAALTLWEKLARTFGLAGLKAQYRAPLAWGASALLVLIVAGAGLLWQKGHSFTGLVDFAEGQVEIRNGAGSSLRTGLGQFAFLRNAALNTSPDSAALLHLGKTGDVRVAMAPATNLDVTAENHIDLRHGAVWLRVRPGGKGFTVSTPSGNVRVTGTVFGVESSEAGTRVDVSEGTVVVSVAGNEAKVSSGQTVSAQSGGIGQVLERENGAAVPSWVETLRGEEARASQAGYIPSITTHVEKK